LANVKVVAGNFGMAMNGTHYFEMFRYKTDEATDEVNFHRKAIIVDIYFVVNFHGIRSFLSGYDPSQNNLVLVSEEETATLDFFATILPKELIRRIPHMKFLYGARWVDVIGNMIAFARAKQFARTWLPRADHVTVHLYSTLFPPNYFPYIFEYVRLAELVYFVPSHKGFYLFERHRPLSRRQKIMKRLYSVAAGGSLDYFVDSARFPILGLGEEYPEKYETLLEWSQISTKYSFQYHEFEPNALLIVDMPLQIYSGIDLAASQKTLVSYFKAKIDLGKKVHLKPHYARPKINSFQGTELEHRVRVLPHDFPVEMVFDDYTEVYCFQSASMMSNSRIPKFSLLKLLTYKDPALRKQLIEDAKTVSGGEHSNLVFLEPFS